MEVERKRFVIAVTGASGALYAVRMLKAGLEMGFELQGGYPRGKRNKW